MNLKYFLFINCIEGNYYKNRFDRILLFIQGLGKEVLKFWVKEYDT
jgi:hypothetical protein